MAYQEPHCARCLQIATITNERDRNLARNVHDVYADACRHAAEEAEVLNRLSRERTHRAFSLRQDRMLGEADFTAYVNPRLRTSVICQAFNAMVLVVIGIVLGMLVMSFLVP